MCVDDDDTPTHHDYLLTFTVLTPYYKIYVILPALMYSYIHMYVCMYACTLLS